MQAKRRVFAVRRASKTAAVKRKREEGDEDEEGGVSGLFLIILYCIISIHAYLINFVILRIKNLYCSQYSSTYDMPQHQACCFSRH